MTVSRGNVEFAKRIFYDRLGNDYVYGGTFDPFDIKAGADCSGLVTDELGAVFFGTAMKWDREGLSTESYRYRDYGPQRVGPFDLVHVGSLGDIPADAAVVINLHHEGAGGPDSHMNCIVDQIYMEESGTYGACTAPKAIPANSSFWNDHWYVPGPIVEDGATPAVVPTEPSDTIFADVSEFQSVVNDAYTNASFTGGNGVSSHYNWLSIRSNDGDHLDSNFAANYQWCVKACDEGRLKGFIVYFYWRPGPQDVDNHIRMVTEQGGPHPQMVSMMDIESGGNPGGDQSPELTQEYNKLVAWLRDPKRVIGYANLSDERLMWQFKPQNVPFILAGYGANPDDPAVFKIAHQYTDGQGYGGGLPEGAPPFGNCDMNSADGFSPSGLAAALGVRTDTGGDALAGVDVDRLNQAVDKILGGGTMPAGWLSRGMFAPASEKQEGVDDTVGMLLNADGNSWNVVMVIGYLIGVERDVQAVKDTAAGKFPEGSFAADNEWLKQRSIEFATKLIAFKNTFLAGPGPAPKQKKAK